MPENIERVFAIVGPTYASAYRGTELLQEVSWVGIFNYLGHTLTMSQVIAIEVLYSWLAAEGFADVPLFDPGEWLDPEALRIIRLKLDQ